MKHYSRNTSLGAVFAEWFIRNKRDLLKKVVFEKSDINCVDVLPTITNNVIIEYILLQN